MIKQFSFHLIWFDIIPSDNCYGAGLLTIQNLNNDEQRSLFCIYWDSTFHLSLFFMNIIDPYELTVWHFFKDVLKSIKRKIGWCK